MALKTVLQYVQACLSTMDSDDVDAIAETEEATQIANLLADVYAELINRQDWEFLKRPITLTAAGDSAKPTLFNVPVGVRELRKVWYNISSLPGGLNRRELKRLEPEDFLERYGSGEPGGNRILVQAGQQLQFTVRNDKAPEFYTTFDDRSLWCDSYDLTVETSLVSSKVSAYGVVVPVFEVTDNHVPDLPENMVPLLQSTLNGVSHLYFKQQASPPDEARALRQMAQARRKNSVVASRESYYANAFGRR